MSIEFVICEMSRAAWLGKNIKQAQIWNSGEPTPFRYFILTS